MNIRRASPAATTLAGVPFTPGTSPFRVKGITYMQHVEYVNAHVPGGETAVNRALPGPLLRAFFGQMFLASAWYDVFPLVQCAEVCAKLVRQSTSEFVRVRARTQARNDIHGAYRLLLNVASAETVALRMPRIVRRYFDFGNSEARVTTPGVVRIEYTGLPSAITEWFALVSEVYFAVALEIAGASRARTRFLPPVEDGEAHGVQLARVTAEVELAASADDQVP